jgi:hypothetical protein
MTLPQMKVRWVIPAIILAIAAVFGWQIDGRHTAARVEEGKLGAEARRLGIADNEGHLTRTKKVERVDRQAEAKQLAVEYVMHAKEWQADAVVMDEAAKQRHADIYRRLSELEPIPLRIFTLDVLASMDLREKAQVRQAVSLLRTLAGKDPAGALDFFRENSLILRKDSGAAYIVSDALDSWAKDDPIGAAEWMKKNAAEFPEALSGQSQGNVIRRAAEKDPRVAFSLITGLGLDFSNAHTAMYGIVTSATTDEAMTATLAALREYREANRSNKELTRAADDNLGNFADELSKQSFDAGSKWIENAKLNPKELDSICQRLGNGLVEEPGRWIEWMGRAFPPGKGDSNIMYLIGNWTEQDYGAAGKWLASAPEGSARNAAIRGYAQTIFQHDSETAMQWIMTLPPGGGRDDTLINIYENWPKDDPAGAEAFKAEHGIK